MPAADERIYLDNAATSWPKPDAVYEACDRYLRELGAPAGRSAYGEANEVSQAIRDARRAVAEVLGAGELERIIFTLNGTDALNQAIHGLLRPGDHVVTTVVEHNSVLRPLRHLEEQGAIEVSRVRCGADVVVSPDEVAAALRSETRLVALVHASNVTGALQPAAEIGRLARDRGAVFLLDAAQSLGHVPIDVEQLGVDLLAAPGHKGLLGPLGTGVLYLGPGIEEQLDSTRQGGTGSFSEDDHQPERLPDKYESGNLNAVGLVGLRAGARYVLERGVNAIHEHTIALTARMLDGFGAIDGVRVYGPTGAEQNVGVVSICVEGYDPQEVAAMLETGYRVQVRSGLHCAPLMHEALGTRGQGGTVRFSVGPFNTREQIDKAIRAVEEIAAAALPV